MKITSETVERKYQELLEKTTPPTAIQLLSESFTPKVVSDWLVKKSQGLLKNEK